MRILALDVGDVYTGTALSDALGIIASPYKTILTKELDEFLKLIIEKEEIRTIVIGYPKTMKGNISEQTQKIINFKEYYEKSIPQVSWVLWDERLTSKNAEKFKKSKEKADKIKLHSIAAALILDTYLDFLRFKNFEINKD